MRTMLVTACWLLSVLSISAAPSSPQPTPLPKLLSLRATPNEIYEFYSPPPSQPSRTLSARDSTPSFPADIPSCPKCQQDYPNLSHCMGAASVFANTTNLFNNPVAYINVIRCACTDTFQAVFPQCVDCFQRTDQCSFLGTDSAGTGAPTLITNIRNICAFGSALLGGVASANSDIGTLIPTAPGTFTDVSSTGWGYHDQTTGDIFQSYATTVKVSKLDLHYKLVALVSFLVAAILAGAFRLT